MIYKNNTSDPINQRIHSEGDINVETVPYTSRYSYHTYNRYNMVVHIYHYLILVGLREYV